MQSNEMMSDGKHVFISYAREDQDYAMRLTETLENAGFAVWSDKKIRPGTRSWQQAVRDAIDDSFAVVLVATPYSAHSEVVQGELNWAYMRRRHVIPVKASEEEWPKCIALGMVDVQYLDCHGASFAFGLQRLTSELEVALAAHLAKDPSQLMEIASRSTAAFLQVKPLTVAVLRFAQVAHGTPEWNLEDTQVDEMVKQKQGQRHVSLLHRRIVSTVELLSALRDFDCELIQFSGDMNRNGIYISEAKAGGYIEYHLSADQFSRYLDLALSRKTRVLLLTCCCAESEVAALASCAPYIVAVTAKFPSIAPSLFVQTFLDTYINSRSVEQGVAEARLQLEAHHVDLEVFTPVIKRARHNASGKSLIDAQIDGYPDPVTIDLTAVQQAIRNLGIPQEDVPRMLATKIRAHGAIFRIPREDAILSVGPIIHGTFSWDIAAGYIRCTKLFKFKPNPNPVQWKAWCRLHLVYNDLAGDSYRALARPGDPTSRTTLTQAHSRFTLAFHSLQECIVELSSLGFGDVENLYTLGYAYLERAKDKLREQDLPMVVSHMESALTHLHDIVKVTMPEIVTYKR